MAPNEESIGGIYIYFISVIRLYKFTKLTWFRTPHGRLVCILTINDEKFLFSSC